LDGHQEHAAEPAEQWHEDQSEQVHRGGWSAGLVEGPSRGLPGAGERGAGHRGGDEQAGDGDLLEVTRRAGEPGPQEDRRLRDDHEADRPAGAGSAERRRRVIELARTPRSTDVLGAYAVELDKSGELIGYRRRRRYNRSQADED